VFISLSLHVQGQHFIEPRKIQNLIVHARKIQHEIPVMIVLFGEKCIERQHAKQARQGKPMYLAIQGAGDHPEMKK
jgi:hypothetical protein